MNKMNKAVDLLNLIMGHALKLLGCRDYDFKTFDILLFSYYILTDFRPMFSLYLLKTLKILWFPSVFSGYTREHWSE